MCIWTRSCKEHGTSVGRIDSFPDGGPNVLQGIEVLTKACEACKTSIDAHKGRLLVKEAARAVRTLHWMHHCKLHQHSTGCSLPQRACMLQPVSASVPAAAYMLQPVSSVSLGR